MLAILSIVLAEAQGDRSFTATALERGIHCSPSSLLMLILLLWSIPVLIYAILLFPVLKQSVRGRSRDHPRRKDESDKAGSEFTSRIFTADDNGDGDRVDVQPAHGGLLEGREQISDTRHP